MIRSALLLLLAVPALAHAQVYKCSGKSGETVYSQQPCTSTAQPHVLRNGQLAGSNLRVDRQCLDQARASIYAASNDRISALQVQIDQLRRSGNNGPRIAQLEQQIDQQNRQANQQVNAARSECLRERAPEPVPAPPSFNEIDT